MKSQLSPPPPCANVEAAKSAVSIQLATAHKRVALLIAFMLVFILHSFAQSALDPGRGQFFEQGYSVEDDGLGNEMAIDLCVDTDPLNPAGLVFVGWHESEATQQKDLVVFKTNAFGKLLFNKCVPGNSNELATGIVADPINSRYLVCVRKTTSYVAGAYEAYGDSMLVYEFSYQGAVTLLHRQGYEEEGLAPIDIALGAQNTFYVLANKKTSSGAVTPVLTKFNYNGYIGWQYTHPVVEQSIRAHELVVEAEAVRFSANDITDVTYPMLMGVGINGAFNHANKYTNLPNAYVDGLAKQNNDYLLAGKRTVSGDEQAMILKVNANLTYNNDMLIGQSGSETYTDIMVHDYGFVCTGLIDSSSALTDNEGGKDILISHFNPEGEVFLHETVGSPQDEEVGRTVAHPIKPALLLAGYHKGYGINESGNAYIAASLYEDVRSLITGTCEVPRSLWVDNFTWHDGTGKIDLTNRILGNSAEEAALIKFAKDNKIEFLLLYGLNFIFDPNYQSASNIAAAKVALSNFISLCQSSSPTIRVGLISTSKLAVYNNAIQYNIDVTNNASQFNYSQNGKISFFTLEHEFWNASDINAFSGNTAFNPSTGANNNEDGNPATDVPLALLNDHFENCWNDHQMLLSNLRSNNQFDANVNGLYDYIGELYFNHSTANALNNSANTAQQLIKAQFIEQKADAIFLVYYRTYNPNDKGLNFITSFQPAKNRIQLFGTQSSYKPSLVPLFSAESYDASNDSLQCGRGASTDFLGKELQPFGTSSLYSVEKEYTNQHQILINDPINYPDLSNTAISAFSWYKYSCIKSREFDTTQKVSCRPWQTPLFTANTAQSKLNFQVYPNPNNGQFTLKVEQQILELSIFSSAGLRVFYTNEQSVNTLSLTLSSGLYILIATAEDGTIATSKMLVYE